MRNLQSYSRLVVYDIPLITIHPHFTGRYIISLDRQIFWILIIFAWDSCMHKQ